MRPARILCDGEGSVLSRRVLGLVIAVIGIALVVLSVFADPIGIGVNEEYAFGWKQALGTAAGASLVVVGLLAWRARRAPFFRR